MSAQTIGLFVLAAAALVALILQARHRDPLIELRFFRSAFSGATLIAVSAFVARLRLPAAQPRSIRAGARGLSPFDAGLYILPMAAVTVVVGPLTGRLIGRDGPRARRCCWSGAGITSAR